MILRVNKKERSDRLAQIIAKKAPATAGAFKLYIDKHTRLCYNVEDWCFKI